MIRRPSHLWAGYELRSPVVRRQIEWADHHREVLHSTFNAFRDRRPYFITENRREYEGTEYRVMTAHSEPAPDEIGLILADYLNALRAALDYLVGEMRPDGPTRNSGFPLFLQRPPGQKGRFRNRACGYLRDIPDDAVKLIHWMQPYHRTDEGLRHTFKSLGAIETLWNIAKHRTLFVVTAATRPDYVVRERSDEQAKGIRYRYPGPDHSSDIWLPITEPQEEFQPHFDVHISLAQPRGFASDWPEWVETWELDGLVDHFYRVIRWEVVPQFNEFIQLGGEPPPAHRTASRDP
jgi:hypothetical protein